MAHRILHPTSALLGAGACAASLWLASPGAVQTETARVALGPYAWRDLVRIEESYPYTVLEEHVLVLVSVGHTSRKQPTTLSLADTELQVLVDGELELILNPVNGPNSITPGWVVPAGSRVSIEFADDTWTGYAFGYLVDA